MVVAVSGTISIRRCHGIDLCEVYPGVGLGVVQRRRPAKRLVVDPRFFSFFFPFP